MPDAVFSYNHLNQLNAEQYEQEQPWQKIINIATILAFLVCCLGLFGMTYLSINQRVKEVGVRKVLGATISQIIILLSVNFLKLILISFVVAIPIAWWAANLWLQDYAYRIKLGPWIFVLAGTVSLFIGAITVSIQAIKAANANPVKSLRTE